MREPDRIEARPECVRSDNPEVRRTAASTPQADLQLGFLGTDFDPFLTLRMQEPH